MQVGTSAVMSRFAFAAVFIVVFTIGTAPNNCFAQNTQDDGVEVVEDNEEVQDNQSAPKEVKPESIFADGTGSQQLYDNGPTYDDLYNMMLDFGGPDELDEKMEHEEF